MTDQPINARRGFLSQAAAVTTGGLFLSAATTSASAGTPSDVANVLHFASPGTTDFTDAIQAAINTGKLVYLPTGVYPVTRELWCSVPGQIIAGDGRTRSVIVAQPGFSGAGVFNSPPQEQGPQFRDLKVTCVQPTDGALNNYPPAFRMVDVPRFTITNVQCTLFQIGIDMTRNSGGVFIDTLELSCFKVGIIIDGCLDIVRINNLHYWPFDMLRNPRYVDMFFSTDCQGITCGRCDGLFISNSLTINGGTHIHFYRSSLGPPWAQITNHDFDTFASVVVDAGSVLLSNCYWTIGLNARRALIKCSDGLTQVDNSLFLASNVLDGEANIQVVGNGQLTVTNCQFQNNANPDTKPWFYCDSHFLKVNNSVFSSPAVTYVSPYVVVTDAGSLSFTNNTFAGGAGVALSVASDRGKHIIMCNQFADYLVTLVRKFSQSVIRHNSGARGRYRV